jgi:hypothetical protein
VIVRNTASLYNAFVPGTPGVVMYDAGTLNAGTSHTSSTPARAYGFTGTLSSKAGRTVRYALARANPQTTRINDAPYDLANGRVFLLDVAGEVRRMPFAPLEPSERYLGQLQTHFQTGKPAQAIDPPGR